ncbi:MAG: rod shape-determining protein MreC [Oscillospiraceae bacterium]|nr:rod shape-determining protein MreC [Oscillospiraceae bacterium]MBQ3049523.1 rod shape-determining protein MreC [Oscillospiraceae bacterium]
MQEFFKGWRFKVLLALLVFILAILLRAAASGGFGDILEQSVGVVTSPIMKLSTKISDGATEFFQRIVNVNKVYEENEKYRERINELNKQLIDYEAVKKENEQFRDYLELKEENTDYTFEAATVIGRDPNDRYYSFVIDAGSRNSIETGDPVITADGLIGVVYETGANYSKVMTILNPSLNVGCYDIRTGDSGILVGDLELLEEGCCKFQYIPRDSGAANGDLAVTSGGGIFPRDLVIGTILSIHAERDGVSLYAKVKPSANITNVKNVFIITSFDGQWDVTDDENLAIDKMYLEHQNKKKEQAELQEQENSETEE